MFGKKLEKLFEEKNTPNSFDPASVRKSSASCLGMERPVSRGYLGHQITHEQKVFNPTYDEKSRFFIKCPFSTSNSPFDAEFYSLFRKKSKNHQHHVLGWKDLCLGGIQDIKLHTNRRFLTQNMMKNNDFSSNVHFRLR